MSGENMIKTDNYRKLKPYELKIDQNNILFYAELLYKILEKITEYLEESRHRTPYHISSYPYIIRALALARTGLESARILAKIAREKK